MFVYGIFTNNPVSEVKYTSELGPSLNSCSKLKGQRKNKINNTAFLAFGVLRHPPPLSLTLGWQGGICCHSHLGVPCPARPPGLMVAGRLEAGRWPVVVWRSLLSLSCAPIISSIILVLTLLVTLHTLALGLSRAPRTQFYLMFLTLKVLSFHLKCLNFCLKNLLNYTILSNCDFLKYFLKRLSHLKCILSIFKIMHMHIQ